MPMMTHIHRTLNVAAFPFSDHPSPAPSPAKRNHPRLLSFLLRTLIMVLIIALFFLFLGVAAIVFAHLCLASQTLHRRRSGHRHVTATATATSRSGRLGYSVDELRGMLPKRRVREEEMMVCAICLDDLVGGEWCGSLKECGHCFHHGCVERWLIRVPNCPVCRAEVVLDNDEDRDKDRMCVSRGDSDDLEQLWGVFR